MSDNCSIIQKSLDWCQGRPVLPGIKRDVYFIAKSLIVGWPSLTKGANGRPTAGKYQGEFSLAEGAKWHRVQHLANKAEFKSETQGEFPSQTFKITATLYHPGVDENAVAAGAGLLNSDNVFIVQDMEGNYRVVGSEYYETVTTVARDQGTGATGTAGTTIVVEASDIVDSPFYEGPIVTDEGTINATA